MALTQSFLQRREMTQPISKERFVASSSEFLPIWASEHLRARAIGLSPDRSQDLQVPHYGSPFADRSPATILQAPAAGSGAHWMQQDQYRFPATSVADPRDISSIHSQEQTFSYEPEEDEESHAVQTIKEPGKYQYEPIDREETLSKPHQALLYQEPKNLKGYSWVAEDAAFEADGITNITNSIGAFSRSFLFTGPEISTISQASIETADLPSFPVETFRGLDRFEMYERFKTLVLRLHDERNPDMKKDEELMKVFLKSIELCGEFDAEYIADSLGEELPEPEMRMASQRSMGSQRSRGTVQMEHVKRSGYVPLSAAERREKVKKYAHASDELLDKIAADVRSKDRVVEDNGRGLVITVETIRKMSNLELTHWINTRKAAVNRQKFMLHGRPAPRMIATFLKSKDKDEQKRLLDQMNGGGLFVKPPRRQKPIGEEDEDDEADGFFRTASDASSLGRAAIPVFQGRNPETTLDSDWEAHLKAYHDEVVHRIHNPFFRPPGERIPDPSLQTAESKAQKSQFSVAGMPHVVDSEEVEEMVRGGMPKRRPWAEAVFHARDDFQERKWKMKMERTRLYTDEDKRLMRVHKQHAEEIRTHTRHHHIKVNDKRRGDINRFGGLDGRSIEPAINYGSRIPYLNQFNNYAVVTKKNIS